MSSAAAIMVTAASAQAGTYIPVPMVPGAVSEIVFSINNHNVVAGSYRDSANVEHGFSARWTAATGQPSTRRSTAPPARKPDILTIMVRSRAWRSTRNSKWARNSTFTQGQVQNFLAQWPAAGWHRAGYEQHRTSVGDYIGASGKTMGYMGQNGKYIEDFKFHLKATGIFCRSAREGSPTLLQSPQVITLMITAWSKVSFKKTTVSLEL